MNLHIKKIFLITLVVIPYFVFAQKQLVGRIVDKDTKKPIYQAKVTIQRTDSSTFTNSQGFFQLLADTTDTLVIYSSGYEIGKVKIPQADKFQLSLTKAPSEEFYRSISRIIQYPAQARGSNIQGRVYVSFVIDSIGEIGQLKLLKDIGGGCGKEVLRVLQDSPYQWAPQASATTFILPVEFKLAQRKPKNEDKEIELPPGTLLMEIVVTAYIR